MRALRLSPQEVATSEPDELAKRIAEHIHATTGHNPGTSEKESWRKSLPALARQLVEAGRSHVAMLVEYRLPYTSMRADVILAGKHPVTGDDSYVVVELKQWTSIEYDRQQKRDVLVHAKNPYRSLHPVKQVAHYCEYIREHTALFETEGSSIQGVAYLHNATNADVVDLLGLPATENGRLYTKDSDIELREYFRSRFIQLASTRAVDRLLGSIVRPSPRLTDLVAKVLQDRHKFILLNEQQSAFNEVISAVEHSHSSDKKKVIIVSGGPGSGKSVIALSLLSKLLRSGYNAVHATGSSAFTNTMRKLASKEKSIADSPFKFFNQFGGERQNQLDAIICDEAHRIRKFSSYPTKERNRRGPAYQVDELLDAARVPVFLLDEHQNVRPNEVGTVEYIASRANDKGHEVIPISLNDQFRCGGSRVYEKWVTQLLGLEGDGPIPWTGNHQHFTVQLTETPDELSRIIRDHGDTGATARITGGFCWKWTKSDGSELTADVKIGTWHKAWNADSEDYVGEAPPKALWATEPGGIGQIGCIYTAQGFEYDWNGVILGPDIIVDNGKLAVNATANVDKALKNLPPGVTADKYIRHIYKVLLTRGMRGTIIHAVDPEVRELLGKLLDPSHRRG